MKREKHLLTDTDWRLFVLRSLLVLVLCVCSYGSARKRSTFLGQFSSAVGGDGGRGSLGRSRSSTDAQGRPRKTVGRVRMLSHAASNVSMGLGLLGGIPKSSMDIITEDR